MNDIFRKYYLGALSAVFIMAILRDWEILAIFCLILSLFDIDRLRTFSDRMLKKIEDSDKGSLPGGIAWSISPSASMDEEFKIEEYSGMTTDFFELFQTGHEALKKGKLPKAKNYLEKAYTLNADDENLCINLGLLFNLIGDNQKSIDYSRQALKLNPKSFIAQFNLAVATNHLKGAIASKEEYEKAENMATEQGIKDTIIIGKLNLFLGHDNRDLGNIADANIRYKEAIRIFDNVGTGEAAYWLNDAKRELGRLKSFE